MPVFHFSAYGLRLLRHCSPSGCDAGVADASDAGAGVLHMQQVQGAGQITWQRLDASPAEDVVLASAASRLAAANAAA